MNSPPGGGVVFLLYIYTQYVGCAVEPFYPRLCTISFVIPI